MTAPKSLSSAEVALDRFAREFPMLAAPMYCSPEVFEMRGFKDFAHLRAGVLFDDLVRHAKTHGFSCKTFDCGMSVPPVSDALLEQLRKYDGPRDDKEHIGDTTLFDRAYALNLATRLPSEWCPTTQNGMSNLTRASLVFHELIRRPDHFDCAVESAWDGDGMGLTISNDDLKQIFVDFAPMSFDGFFPWGHTAIDDVQDLAAYGIFLAGLEAEYLEWNTTSVLPEKLKQLEFSELLAAMKKDGLTNTMAQACSYRAELDAHLEAEREKELAAQPVRQRLAPASQDLQARLQKDWGLDPQAKL